MRKLTLLLSFVALLALLTGCGKDESPEDNTPPRKPTIFPLADEFTTHFDSVCAPQQVGAFARNAFRIAWMSDPDVSTWEVYYQYPNVPGTTRNVNLGGSATEFVARDTMIYPDLLTDTTRIVVYWIHGIDAAGNRSAPSDTIRFGILREAETFEVSRIETASPLFVWNSPYSSPERAPNLYVLKLLSSDGRLVWRWSRTYDTSYQVPFNEDNTADTLFMRENGSLRAGEYTIRLEFWLRNEAGSVATRQFTIF